MLFLLIGSLVLLFAAAVISYPLLFEPLQVHEGETEPKGELYTERDALLENLSDLETSLKTGKVNQAVYETQKARLQREYLELLDNA